MLQWKDIDTVLLDMDGTLLDLHFDNHFWMDHLPKRMAEINGLDVETVKSQLHARYNELHGTLQWYCLDYWQEQLNLNLNELKREIAHLIQMREDVPDFLNALRAAGKQVVLVTNAHPDSLSLKIERTEIANLIDELISTHVFGVTKENQSLWQQLQQRLNFDPKRTAFIDDSLPILGAAQTFGIAHLVAVANPDSQMETRKIDDFNAITDYLEFTQQLQQLKP